MNKYTKGPHKFNSMKKTTQVAKALASIADLYILRSTREYGKGKKQTEKTFHQRKGKGSKAKK